MNKRDESAKEAKKIQQMGTLKVLVFLVLIILQIRWLVLIIFDLAGKFPWLSTVLTYASAVLMLYIYARNISPSFKFFWILLIAVFPIVGLCLYALGGSQAATRKVRKKFENAERELGTMLKRNPGMIAELKTRDPSAGTLAHFLSKYAFAPLYRAETTKYYSDTSSALRDQEKALENARNYIFMEYHAIEDGKSFQKIKEILIRKAAEGVDVRIIYDDLGSILMLKNSFQKELESHGIACRSFNPVTPFLNVFMNYRDHRKITIVDGKTGFAGGYNIADQYCNITQPYGYWKDTGVCITGAAVESMTAQFLMMWESLSSERNDAERFLYKKEERPGSDISAKSEISGCGFVQPYCDDPLDNEPVSEEIYLHHIRKANNYVWFSTPYLIITDEMRRELISAAKRGIDVRIVVPGIPDKKLVNQCTKSYYGRLVAGGVKIYEYTPGFNHAKLCIADGESAVVGSANLDYRSLYHHFENGIVFYHDPVVETVRQDLQKMMDVSRQISLQSLIAVPRWKKAFRMLIRLAAPML